MMNAFDGRTQIQKTADWPNSVHGLVVCKFDNRTCWGTGILIGPNVVLTAGHILYDSSRKTYADLKSIQFLPGMNGQLVPFGLIDIKKYYVSPNYIQEEKEDYGILILKNPIGEMTGYFGLACLKPEEILTKRINITGYPADKVASRPNTYEMWGMEGEACHVDEAQCEISYHIDTSAGQAGSGVWYKEGDDYYVCGVHVMGTHTVNKGTLLTKAICEQIQRWISENENNEEYSIFKGKSPVKACLQ